MVTTTALSAGDLSSILSRDKNNQSVYDLMVRWLFSKQLTGVRFPVHAPTRNIGAMEAQAVRVRFPHIPTGNIGVMVARSDAGSIPVYSQQQGLVVQR